MKTMISYFVEWFFNITMLKRFSDSKSSLLLTTTFSGIKYYQELQLSSQYRFRLINLENPFSLVRPICLSEDGSGGHYLGLWKLPLTRITNCKPQTAVTQFKKFFISVGNK